MVLDRDINAAGNRTVLVAWSTKGVAGSGPDTETPVNGATPGVRLVVLGAAGSRHQGTDLDQTGTADW
jgi:hypothetical protein